MLLFSIGLLLTLKVWILKIFHVNVICFRYSGRLDYGIFHKFGVIKILFDFFAASVFKSTNDLVRRSLCGDPHIDRFANVQISTF